MMTTKERRQLETALSERYADHEGDHRFWLAFGYYLEGVERRDYIEDSLRTIGEIRNRILDRVRGAEPSPDLTSLEAFLSFLYAAEVQVRAALADVDRILDSEKEILDSWEDGDVENAIRIRAAIVGAYSRTATENESGAKAIEDEIEELD